MQTQKHLPQVQQHLKQKLMQKMHQTRHKKHGIKQVPHKTQHKNAQDAIESLGVGGRNLCTKRTPRVTSEVSLDYSGYSWKMEFAGGSAYSGLIIPATIFTPGKQYVISF